MKKMIFLFMALSMSNVIKAQPMISKDIVEQVKAIVAYEMNVLSLRPDNKSSIKDKECFENFKECASKKNTVDDVKNCLPEDYGKCKELCNDIKNKNSEFVDVDAVIAYYSDSIFQQKGGAIGAFIDKRNKNDVDRLKKAIKNRIQEITDGADVLIEPEISEQPIEEEQLNTEYDNKSLPDQLTEDSSMDETVGLMDSLKNIQDICWHF